MPKLLSPEIVNLRLQSIRIPGGWCVEINHFYELDPDEDLGQRQVQLPPDAQVNDVWDDVLRGYFDHSYLWTAVRVDRQRTASIEWTPMGAKNGSFELTFAAYAIKHLTTTPPSSVSRQHEGEKLHYALVPEIELATEKVRKASTRNRLEIVTTLEEWLWQDCLK